MNWITANNTDGYAIVCLKSSGRWPFSKKEKALLYLVGYVILILMGSGKYSVDDRLNG